MKNKIILNLVLGLMTSLTSYCYDDLEKGVDLSARTTVTGVLLNQLVDNATVRTNRGLVIATNNAPDVVRNPRLKNYLWLDTSIEPPVLKFYSETLGWITASLSPNSVSETNIANYAVTSVKLNDNSVTTRSISNNAVTVQKLMDAAVTTDKILDSAVTREKINDGAINGNKITNNVITASHIVGGTITSNQIAVAGIDGVNIASRTILSNNIATNTIAWYNIGQNEITTYNITNSAVVSSKIADGSINTNHLSPALQSALQSALYNPNSYLLFTAPDGTVSIKYMSGIITNVTRDDAINYTIYLSKTFSSVNGYIVQLTAPENQGALHAHVKTRYVNKFSINIILNNGYAVNLTSPMNITVTEAPGATD